MTERPLTSQRLACLIGVAFTLNGCSPARWEPKEATPIIQPVERYPEIRLYYPALTGLTVWETSQLNTERSLTKYFNLSSAHFDPAAARETIEYFEKLAASEKSLLYQFRGEFGPFSLGLKPRTQRVIFLVPERVPTPPWPNVASTAATTGIFEGGPYVSFVRIYNRQEDLPASRVFTTIEKAANKALVVEICQSSIQVSSLTAEVANLGQEIVCNSWGAAFALKQDGFAYSQYTKWARTTSIRANPQSSSYPLYVVTEPDYRQIPKIGAIIKIPRKFP